MTLVKRMHYVPVCLLVYFADGNEKIWVYDKQTGKWFCTNPINVAVEKDMYPQEVEEWFSREVEGPVSGVFKKVSEQRTDLTENEMAIIAAFISEQIIRGPLARRSALEKYESPGSKVLNELMSDIANQWNLLERYSDFSMSSTHRETLQRLVKLSESDPEQFRAEMGLTDSFKGTLEARIRTDQPNRIADFLMRLAWRLIYAERERYVICDNPVAVWHLGADGGANSDQFECVLPISANCALHIGRYGQGRIVNEILTDDGLVRRLNSRMVARALRFIYSSREERWVKKSAHYKSPRLPHLRFDGPLIEAKFDRPPCPNCRSEYTQQEWDAGEISYRGEETEKGYILEEIRTIPHSCSVRRY